MTRGSWVDPTNQRSGSVCDSDCLCRIRITLVKQLEEKQCPYWESVFSYLPDHLKMPKAKGKLNPAVGEAHKRLLCSKFRGWGNWDSWCLELQLPLSNKYIPKKGKTPKGKEKTAFDSTFIYLFFIYHLFWKHYISGQCFPNILWICKLIQCKKYTFHLNPVCIHIYLQTCIYINTHTHNWNCFLKIQLNYSWAIWYFSILFHFFF